MTAELRVDAPNTERTSLCGFGWIDSYDLPLTEQRSARTHRTQKQNRIFLDMLPWIGRGHNDPKINGLWVPECSSEPPIFSQYFPLTSTSLWFRVRNENFLQTCCEKSKSGMGRWENLKLSWLTLAMFVQAAFVISWCTSTVLYAPNSHRRHTLRADYIEYRGKDS